MDMRIMSSVSTSKVYHRLECRYARRIKSRNRIQMDWETAEWKGYQPCIYCDGTEFLYSLEQEKIKQFAEQFDLAVDIKDYKIYVRTDVGCWKIIYKRSIQRFLLLHRNYVNGRIDLELADQVPFHRQWDMAESVSIMKYLRYIKDHDQFKRNKPADYRQMPRRTKRQKAYYKSAERKAQKQSARRVECLFTMIECREGIKKLSFC